MLKITPQEAIHDISYVNIIMYSRAMQTYEPKEKDKANEPEWDESKDMCNPANFANEDFEETIVKA